MCSARNLAFIEYTDRNDIVVRTGPQIIEVACSVKLNHSCRFIRHWRVSASTQIRTQSADCLLSNLTGCRACAVSLQPLARPASHWWIMAAGVICYPFGELSLTLISPRCIFCPSAAIPHAAQHPTAPPPPPSSLINSRLHEGKQLISPTKVTVTWAPASGGYLPAANERRRGKVREKNKGEGKGGGGRKGGAVQGSSFYRL